MNHRPFIDKRHTTDKNLRERLKELAGWSDFGTLTEWEQQFVSGLVDQYQGTLSRAQRKMVIKLLYRHGF